MLVASMFAVTACQKEEQFIPSNQKVEIGSVGSGQGCTPLIAGQSITAGNVCVADADTDNDGQPDQLIVTYSTTDGWQLSEVHLWVGASMTSLPQTNSGNPIPGQFPYKSGALNGVTTYTFNIPFSSFGFSCPGPDRFYVAAHAAVRKPNSTGGFQTETGWGDGERINKKGSWAKSFSIWITCEDVPPPVEYECETAFAYDDKSGQCFANFGEFINNPSRWGWVNGAYNAGNYTLQMWAGAGQCNLSNGTIVGSLNVNYDGETAVVTYTPAGIDPETNMPYFFEEMHLYVGNAMFPTHNGSFTIAPGQYPYHGNGDGSNPYTFTVNNLSGPIYVIAHAQSCGFEKE